MEDRSVSIGDGHNGIRMHDGEEVWARDYVTGQNTFLGVLRFSVGGTPYLAPHERETVIASLSDA